LLHFAKNLVVLSGGRSGNPADLKSSSIRLLHHVETIVVEVEDRKPGCEGFFKSLAAGGTHCIVKFLTREFVGSHNLIVHTGIVRRNSRTVRGVNWD